MDSSVSALGPLGILTFESSEQQLIYRDLFVVVGGHIAGLRTAWAIPVAFFKPPAGRTSFSSFRFAQFIAEAIHILRHLAPPTHTQSVYLARDQRLTTAHSCVFHFQAQVLFFLLRPIGKRFPRTGLDHNLKCQPRSALHEQVPLRETACLYFAPPSLRAQCAA